MDKTVIDGSIIYMDTQVFEEMQVIHAGRKSLSVPFKAFMVFVDLEPKSNWGHSCLYLLIQEKGEVYEVMKEMFPPYHGEYQETWIVLLWYGEQPPHNRYFQIY